MGNPYFRFKQFTVYHHRCAMKVGIDGVLLGAWCNTENASSILDIGTGSGLIALMLAQRSHANITAIDIDKDAIIQSRENFESSPWRERLLAQEISLQDFTKKTEVQFNLIISNPPYFVNSLKAPEKNRSTARHTDHLSHEDLLSCAAKLLQPEGKLCLILPVSEGEKCIETAKSHQLYCHRKVEVFPKPDMPAKRLLMEFGFAEKATELSELTIETNERHHYSPEFTEIAKEYYLKL